MEENKVNNIITGVIMVVFATIIVVAILGTVLS